jgi:hypothetical protein
MAQNRYISTFRAPTEYERQIEEARKRAALAEALAQQEYVPMEGAAAPIPRAAPLVKALQGYLTAREGRKAREAEAEASQVESDYAQRMLGRMQGGYTYQPSAQNVEAMKRLPSETDEQYRARMLAPETFTNRSYEQTLAAAPAETTLAEVTPTSRYVKSPEEALQMASTSVGTAALKNRPVLAARLAEMLKTPSAEEFYAPTETATGLVQFGKRGGKQETGYKAPPKSETPTPLARLIAERDALPPNDPRRATYDAAIKGETQGRGTVVNIPTARDLQKDESGLRDQLEGRLKGMDWPGTQSAMQRILTAPQTPAGDVTIVYALAKANDPSGAVREDDFNKLAQSGSLGQKIQSLYEEANSGRMTPEKRKELIDTALSFYRIREQGVNKLLSDYEGIAKRSGLNIENVIAPFRPMPLWTDEQEKRLQELRKKAASAGGLK